MPKVEPLQRSVSSSGQFIAYDSDKLQRSRSAMVAESIKEEWLKRIHLHDDWKHPIIIYTQSDPRGRHAPVETRVLESDGGAMKVQIDVNERGAFESAEFEQEILRALMIEYMHREAPVIAGKAVAEPPEWLVQGVWEDIRIDRDGVPAGLYENLIASSGVPKLDAFLKQQMGWMDGTSRAIYRAQAQGLLHALVDSPDGTKHLAEYLQALPAGGAANQQLLMQKFSDMADSKDLPKRWALALAHASAANRVDALGVTASDKKLGEALDVTAPVDPKKKDVPPARGADAFPAMAKSTGGRYIMERKEEELMRLEFRSHPLLRPVVEEYRKIAGTLARKPKKNLANRITKNNELRTAIVKHSGEIEDYLNWFEAVKLNTESGEFREMLTDPDERPARRDELTRTLDGVESRGW
jgi:hypothetical protein